MTKIQEDNIARERNHAKRLTERARRTRYISDEINAGWALNTLYRMEQEAQ